jgi:predicted RNA-binding protein YlxR (DUF448 family)
MGHLPVRTCIGCRKKRKKEEMIWFKESIDGVKPVGGKKNLEGRGFYLCPDPICFKKARKRKKMEGSFVEHQIGIPFEEMFLRERI